MLPLWFRVNNGARGGTGPWFRRSRCGFARIPLRFDAPAVVSRELRYISLWFRANSVAFRPLWFRAKMQRCGFARIPASRGLFRPLLGGPLRLLTATARALGRGLGFDAPAVVSREFRCVLMLPLWFRVNSVAFRCSCCGFARIPASRGIFARIPASCGLFRPLLGGPLRLLTATARAVGRGLGFDAPAVVSREFRCVLMLPLWFRANSSLASCGLARMPASRGLLRPLLGVQLRLLTVTARAVGRGLGFSLWFRANSVAF